MQINRFSTRWVRAESMPPDLSYLIAAKADIHPKSGDVRTYSLADRAPGDNRSWRVANEPKFP